MKCTARLAAMVLGAAMVAGIGLGAGAMKDPFEGTWTINAIADGAGKDFKETIDFKGNQLTVRGMKAKGWEPAEYDGDYRGVQMATFKATLKNAKEKGEMTWTGTLAAGEIKGTIVIKTEAKGEERYSYTGSRTGK